MASIVLNLQRSVSRFGDKPAIESRSGAVSYRELWNRAAAVARELQGLGLRAGDRVAVILDNSADYIAVYYGILAAGGIAVALNPGARAREFVHWLTHSGTKWVFAAPNDAELQRALSMLQQPPQPLVVSAAVSGRDSVCRCSDWEPSTPATILYTSGTTGDPKGVLLSHGNLASNVEAIIDYLHLDEHDRSVVVLPFFYSYGSSVLHTHLAVGATLILEANLVYPQRAVETMVASRCTGFAGVPSTFALLLDRTQMRESDLSTLRYVTQAGGAMPSILQRRLREALPHSQVFVMYGQTEATARISWLPPEQLDRKPGSVGLPVHGVELAIRGDDGQSTAPLEQGEVWIRGPNVMLGYWRNLSATAAALRDGWLRTGDLGHLDEDGYLFLAGRRSDMIKSGAHRIHPQEVEEVIAGMPDVAEVAVIAAKDELLEQCVCAVVVMRAGVAGSAQRVKAWCRDRMAGHKIPKRVEFRDALPRTASGKLRRQAIELENVE